MVAVVLVRLVRLVRLAALVAAPALVVAGCAPADRPVASDAATPSGTEASARREGAVPAGVPAGAQSAVVERVVDGDTVWVRVDAPGGPLPPQATHAVRLLEVDTPETRAPGEAVQCWGPQATAFVEDRLPVGTTVWLESDVEDTDRYGRFLRYVWTADGVLFNRVLVEEGHARAVLYEPNDAHIAELRRAEAAAQRADRGMWGEPCRYAADDAGAPDGSPAGACEPGYDPCVPVHPPDVDCADLTGPVVVTGPDPHHLDGDNDGIGCAGP